METDDRVAFLDEAYELFPNSQPTGEWYCGSCGGSFPLKEVLVDTELVPHCPLASCKSSASGWETVRPQSPPPTS
jgi:hypothetical protein